MRAYSPVTEQRRIVQVVQHQIGRIDAPENLVADGKGGHAEDPALGGLLGALLERLLDLGPRDNLIIGIGDAEPLGERLPLLVLREVAPLGPDGIEDRAHERWLGTLGDGEAQRAQRVEGMGGRHAEGDAVARRVPVTPAVGMDALGRNLRRPLVLPMAEEPSEENRPEGNREVRRQPVELDELQIGEGREKIEVPVGGPHRPIPHVPTSGSRADCARFGPAVRGDAGGLQG